MVSKLFRKRVKLPELWYWKLTTLKVIFTTEGFDPDNPSCQRVTEEKYRELKRKGWYVGTLMRPFTNVSPGWWIS